MHIQQWRRYHRRIKWVEHNIFNTVQDKFDVSKCNIVTKRSLEYIPHTYQLQRLMFKIASTDWGKNRFYFPNNFLVTNHTNPIGAHNLPNETNCTTHEPSQQISITLLYISDSTFTDNIGGGVNIELYMGYSNTIYRVIIRNCSFQKNQSPIGSGLK